MNKEQEDWKGFTNEELAQCIKDDFRAMAINRDEYKALFESAIKKGQELIEENASLQNQNELLQEDNLSLSKALSDLITKMKAEQ